LVLTIFVAPVQRLVSADVLTAQKRARKTVQKVFKFFIAFMEFTQISQFSVKDRELLAKFRGNLVIANHPSLIDVVLLISVIPNADCVVKAHLFRNPFIRGVIKSTGYISNDNAEQLIEDCRHSLEQGNNLIVFPEGTRTTPKQPLKFKRGVANIAIRCVSPIKCLRIDVNPTTLTKNDKWYSVPDRKFEVELRLLSDAPLPKIRESEPLSVTSRNYTRELEQFYSKELENNVRLKS